MKIVIDTNILVSAFKSNKGASYKLLTLINKRKFNIAVSVPLIFEYESVLKRYPIEAISHKDIDDFIDYICQISEKQQIFYLWRPHLKDPKDDHVLEVAFAVQANYIVTYNKKDFKGIEKLGVKACDAKEFLNLLGEL